MSVPISIVYFGTPAYAVPALRGLALDARFVVRLVVTQPDRSAGRGHRLVAPAVKAAAEDLGLNVYQPATLRDEVSRLPLVDAAADVFVVAAYGLIFGRKTLAIPRRGCLNLHASILPAYRGAAPIPAAILAGEAETGVTLMEMEAGLDTGPIVEIVRTPILPDDTTASLTERLGEVGGALVVDALPRWMAGETVAYPQPEGASSVRMLSKADGGIDWDLPAEEIERHVRAMWPWPRAWTRRGDDAIQVHRSSIAASAGLAPGEVGRDGSGAIVGSGTHPLRLDVIQLPGGAPITSEDAIRRSLLATGDRLESMRRHEPLVRPA